VTRLLAAEGVGAIAVCTDDVHRYGRHPRFAPGVIVRPREDVVAVQEDLRRHPGISVLIYDQRCAAEARRLRKRGLLEEPASRVVINQAVCEGCGDCSRVSNCLSVLPVDTEFGDRMQIHQSSCNKDYSCLEGNCPSFVTIAPARRRRQRIDNRSGHRDHVGAQLPAGELPLPVTAPIEHRYSVYTTGIGGTGVVTANRLLAHAAVIAGYSVNGLDQTGLSQKAGAVVSHLQIGRTDLDITTATVADHDADLYISGDVLQAGSARHLAKVAQGRTVAVIDSHLVPTAGMLQLGGTVDAERLGSAVSKVVGADRCLFADTTELAERIFGSHLPANVMLLGAAFQIGAVPLPLEAIERAISDEGPSPEMNHQAFEWGRWLAADRRAVEAALPATTAGKTQAAIWDPSEPAAAAARLLLRDQPIPSTLLALFERRAAQLVDYQDKGLARRWLDLVVKTAGLDAQMAQDHALTGAVAEGFFKLLTYKDEYEVARLHLRLDLDEVAEELGFEGRYRVLFQLHPPFLRRLGLRHKIGIGRGAQTAFRTLAAMRRLRGTRLDLFGYTRHRREERRLAAEYVQTVEQILGHLTPPTYPDAVQLANSVSAIRGYEEIKSASVSSWRSDTAHLRSRFAG